MVSYKKNILFTVRYLSAEHTLHLPVIRRGQQDWLWGHSCRRVSGILCGVIPAGGSAGWAALSPGAGQGVRAMPPPQRNGCNSTWAHGKHLQTQRGELPVAHPAALGPRGWFRLHGILGAPPCSGLFATPRTCSSSPMPRRAAFGAGQPLWGCSWPAMRAGQQRCPPSLQLVQTKC